MFGLFDRRGIGFIQASYAETFAYKFNLFIGFFSNLVTFLIQYYLWKAVFVAGGGQFYGFEQQAYLFYIAAGLVLNQLTTHDADRRLSTGIRTGDIVFEFLKPIKLIHKLWSHTLGTHLGKSYALLPVIPVLFWFVDASVVELSRSLLFLVSLVFAFVLSFQISMLFGLLALWTTNTWGLFLLRHNLFPILSGQIIAIPVLQQIATESTNPLLAALTHGFAQVAYWLPLQATYFTPSGILSGLIAVDNIGFHLAIQVLWMLILGVLLTPIMNRLSQYVTIQGA